MKMWALATVVPLLFLASGCGNNNDTGGTAQNPITSPSSTPTASVTPSPTAAPLPTCARVWVAGKRLPGNYVGCTVNGKPAKASNRPCMMEHNLIVFRHRFFAQTSGKIFESSNLKTSSDYRLIVQLCKYGHPAN